MRGIELHGMVAFRKFDSTIPALAFVNAKRAQKEQELDQASSRTDRTPGSHDAQEPDAVGSALRSVPLHTYVPVRYYFGEFRLYLSMRWC